MRLALQVIGATLVCWSVVATVALIAAGMLAKLRDQEGRQ